MTAIAAHQVTPVECTPWCGDGTGHADAEEVDEQGCYSTERRVDLLRIPVSGQGPATTSLVTVHLYRDAYDGRAEPSSKKRTSRSPRTPPTRSGSRSRVRRSSSAPCYRSWRTPRNRGKTS
jgi:hypothetical protein